MSNAAFQYIRYLMYANSGAGKTYMLGTMFQVEELLPVQWISCDQSHVTIINPEYSRRMNYKPALWDKQRDNGDDTRGNLHEKYGKIYVPTSLEDLSNRVTLLEENTGKYKSIVVDGLSAEWFSEMNARLATPMRGRVEQTIPGKLDYQAVQYPILGMAERLYKMPYHVFVTAAQSTKHLEGQPDSVDLAFNWAILQGIPHFFDIIAQLESRGAGRMLHTTQNDYRRQCKDRTLMLPEIIETPTIPQIYNYLSPLREGNE